MTVRITTKYRKTGGVFETATAANNDKNSKYSAELMDATVLWLENMLSNGILMSPTKLLWDQDTYTLTLERDVTIIEEFTLSQPFTGGEAITLAEDAGWEFISSETADI